MIPSSSQPTVSSVLPNARLADSVSPGAHPSTTRQFADLSIASFPFSVTQDKTGPPTRKQTSFQHFAFTKMEKEELDLDALVASGFGTSGMEEAVRDSSSEDDDTEAGAADAGLTSQSDMSLSVDPKIKKKGAKKKKKNTKKSSGDMDEFEAGPSTEQTGVLQIPDRDSTQETAPAKGSREKKDAIFSVPDLLQKAGFIEQESENLFVVPKGHVHAMHVPGKFYANPLLLDHLVTELHKSSGGFLSAIEQIANVATLPGIVGASLGMPDIHSGYGFAIGNIAAMDMENTEAVVSPGGVGFDINCGVRLLRSNLFEADVQDVKDRLADVLFRAVPVGVGSESQWRLSAQNLDEVLENGMEWTEKEGFSWEEDREVTEEGGRFTTADASKVSSRAKQRGKNQMGTLGSGNHYVEVQVVDEVFDETAAKAMGLEQGTVCIMIHSGSRGLGHQVCTDALSKCDKAMKEHGIKVVDRQLACAPIKSAVGKEYLAAMAAAANFAFCNRTLMAYDVRETFKKVFGKDPREDLGMHMVYDVSHNVAKIEEHVVEGQQKQLLVHRKGATRAFAPGHECIPEKYKDVGQPVLIGGSMGTCSYVLTGTQQAMENTFGSTCHGAGRFMSRSKSMRELDSKAVLKGLAAQKIAVRVATKKLVAEEAPESYKDVSEVVETCHTAGISQKCVRLRPIIVVKG